MDVIFLSSTKGRICSLGICKPVHYLAVLIVFASVIGASIYLGFTYGTSPNYQKEIQAWKKELASQQIQLEQLKLEAVTNVDVLSSRIGLVQAHMMRLDALGRRVMEISNIKEEFDFEKIPAIGGPISVPANSPQNDQLNESLNQLSIMLQSRENQLQILEDLLINNITSTDTYPAGRPITKGWLSSYYGMRTHPISGRREMHKGVDFAGKKGAPVISVAKGIVIFAGKKYGYGRVLDVEHGNGYVTRYAHNSKLLVSVGEQVLKGQQIANIGSSGRSTGPHVHFEVIKYGRTINPIKFIRASK